MPPGQILLNHMAPMAETPHTQNRNGLKVSRKVCSKWLSPHKQCHKHAQRVKVVYSWATWKSSQSPMLHKIHNKQVNVDHSHLTTTQNNKFLIPHSKTKHHMNSFFLRTIRLWNELPTERMPQLYLHLQVDWTSFMLFNWCFNWVI